MLLNYCLLRGSGKCSILSIFSRVDLFIQFFGHVKERLSLGLHEMIGVSYEVFMHNWFYFVLRLCTAWNSAQAHEK